MNRIGQLRFALKETFSRTEGWLIALLGAFFVLGLALVLSNLKLLGFIVHEERFTFGLKVKSAFEILWNTRVAFLHEGGFVTLILALLFGVNAALIDRYMRRQVQLHRAAGASAVGIVIGLLGVGCAACGSALFASLFGIGGALAFLPFHGQEFSWIGILCVTLSTFSLARKLAEPAACPIPEKS